MPPPGSGSVLATTPVEEKVVALERRAGDGHGKQYGLKMLGAGLSNMYASIITNPLDVIKVRQQLRLNVLNAAVVSNDFWSVGREMVRAEGVTSLMRGMTATCLRELSYSSIRLGSYEYFKDKIFDHTGGSLSQDGLPIKVAAASVAAIIGSALANPTDVVKTRMQRPHPAGGRPYRHTLAAFIAVYREGASASPAHALRGGVQSLWRGVDATTYRGLVLSTSQICAYDQAKQSIKRHGLLPEGIGLHIVASSIAGFICTVTSTPIDVVKVRIHGDKERRYKGAFDCVRTTLRNEGPLAFYKGFSMTWARLGSHTILTFLAFEQMRSWLGISPM